MQSVASTGCEIWTESSWNSHIKLAGTLFSCVKMTRDIYNTFLGAAFQQKQHTMYCRAYEIVAAAITCLDTS